METIIKKLSSTENSKKMWDNWSLKDIRQLLEVYLIFVRKEQRILDLVCMNREDDAFQECDDRFFHEKIVSIEETLDILMAEIEKTD